jgi:hypothetical protein
VGGLGGFPPKLFLFYFSLWKLLGATPPTPPFLQLYLFLFSTIYIYIYIHTYMKQNLNKT